MSTEINGRFMPEVERSDFRGVIAPQCRNTRKAEETMAKKRRKYTTSEKIFYGLAILIAVSMVLGSVLAAITPSF